MSEKAKQDQADDAAAAQQSHNTEIETVVGESRCCATEDDGTQCVGPAECGYYCSWHYVNH